MTWGLNGVRYGSHAESSLAAPALDWYFAEGATHGAFDLFYLVQNPSDQAAQVDARYPARAGRRRRAGDARTTPSARTSA